MWSTFKSSNWWIPNITCRRTSVDQSQSQFWQIHAVISHPVRWILGALAFLHFLHFFSWTQRQQSSSPNRKALRGLNSSRGKETVCVLRVRCCGCSAYVCFTLTSSHTATVTQQPCKPLQPPHRCRPQRVFTPMFRFVFISAGRQTNVGTFCLLSS